MRHHYVPQFLLNRWTNVAGKLHTFAIRNGQLSCKDRAPKYTGYVHRLYAVAANVLGFSEDIIEQKFFGRIDNDAAKVLAKLEQHEDITEDEHISWTFFLSSLRVRQPDTLEFLRTDGMKRLRRTLLERDKVTLPSNIPTTERWFNKHYPGAMEATSLTSWLPRMIVQNDVVEKFGKLNWWFREFTADAPKLLLSDLPIHWEGGLNDVGFLIHLPIAPNRIFFGTRSEQTESILTNMSAVDLIRKVNLTTLASSSQWVWASTNEDSREFIQTNIDIWGKNVVPFSDYAPLLNSLDPL